MKLWLFQLMKRAGLDCQCELYDQFSRFITTTATTEGEETQQEKYNAQTRKVKQGAIPDLGATGNFTKQLPGVGDNGFLAEVKTINGGQQYNETIAIKDKNKRCVAVANRAKKIQKEYVKKLRNIDQKYNTKSAVTAKPAIAAKPMVPETTDELGRKVAAVPAVAEVPAVIAAPSYCTKACESHLESFGKILGLVFGTYGEWSRDVNLLMDLCIGQIAERDWVIEGYQCPADFKSVLTSVLKSDLGLISLRLVANLIHSRMRSIGCDMNKTKKIENNLLRSFEKIGVHRSEQLTINRNNEEVNTFRNNHFHLGSR